MAVTVPSEWFCQGEMYLLIEVFGEGMALA